MKIIVLHNIISNEPIVIRADAITAVKKVLDVRVIKADGMTISEKAIDAAENNRREHSTVFLTNHGFDVKETIDVVMQKIKDAREV